MTKKAINNKTYLSNLLTNEKNAVQASRLFIASGVAYCLFNGEKSVKDLRTDITQAIKSNYTDSEWSKKRGSKIKSVTCIVRIYTDYIDKLQSMFSHEDTAVNNTKRIADFINDSNLSLNSVLAYASCQSKQKAVTGNNTESQESTDETSQESTDDNTESHKSTALKQADSEIANVTKQFENLESTLKMIFTRDGKEALLWINDILESCDFIQLNPESVKKLTK